MVRKMLINASHLEECRVAVVCDGVLEELDVQVKAREATLGNIYKAVASRIEPSLQAVFVDYGGSRNGFLSINDVHPSYFPESFEGTRRRPRIQDVFKKDDHVLVQVNKEERDSKGASLTTNISLAGRYLVLMPGTDLYGVSRKIEDEKERQKLKEIVTQFKLPENMGFIIRTAGMGRTKAELSRDLEYLLKLWQSIEKNVSEEQAPALLYKEHDIVIRAIREHFSPDISEILVDDKEVHKKVRDFFHQVMPRYENLVRLYLEKRPLFNKYQLEEQVEQVYRRKIRLKSGGHILIDPTEAMVTVDVNSGSATKEKGIEDTAFRVNMEAVPEIARQLRLRDLGGIIVIDFIDMSHKQHKQEVEKEMKAVLRDDRAKTKMLRISALGLLELTRQRLKSVLGTGEYLECPLCDGQGKIRSPETSALSVYRRIKSLMIRSEVSEVRATVPAKVAEYLLNNMRAQLVEMENQHRSRVTILGKQSLPDKDISVEAVKEEAPEQPSTEALLTPSPVLEIVEAVEAEAVGEAEAEKPRKPGRRRRRPRKKAPSGPEEKALSLEEEPSLEVAPTEATPAIAAMPAGSLLAVAEKARPAEEPLAPVETAEFQPQGITDEQAAVAEPEATQKQEVAAEESATSEEAKKEAKPRRKSWLQDFLPFS
jgi:ribonuclease E